MPLRAPLESIKAATSRKLHATPTAIMPLFKSNQEPTPEPAPTHKGSIFSHRSSSPPKTESSTQSHSTSFFSRRSSSPDDSTPESTSRGSTLSGLFSRNDRDPTILAARQKVTDAENAEKEADRALLKARAMVKEAREHVKILEKEAMEE